MTTNLKFPVFVLAVNISLFTNLLLIKSLEENKWISGANSSSGTPPSYSNNCMDIFMAPGFCPSYTGSCMHACLYTFTYTCVSTASQSKILYMYKSQPSCQARNWLEMVMWMHAYESLTIPWQAFVLVEREYTYWIEHFHHMITTPYTRNKLPILEYNLYTMLLAVYALSI